MWKKTMCIWKKYRFDILFALIAFIAVFSPYLRQDLIIGSDSPFHLARIDSLKEGILAGGFPVKVHSVLCYQYGYGVGLFYPNLFLYIPAFLRIAGLSLEVAYKLYAGLLFLAIFSSMYYCVYRGTQDRGLALLAGALYLFSNPIMIGFYTDFALAQNQAMIFLPLAIMGMFEFASAGKSPWMLAVGFTGLIYSHVLSTVLAFGSCLVILACYIFRWNNWRERLAKLCIAVMGVCGVTFAYWGPMLEQFTAQTYRVSQPWTHVYENVLKLYLLFTNKGVGLVMLFVMLAMAFYLLGNWGDLGKELKISFLLGTALVFLMFFQRFWSMTGSLFDFLQFPARLRCPAVVLLIFSAMWGIKSMRLSQNAVHIIAVAMLGVCIYTGLDCVSDKMENVEDFGGRVIYEEIAGLGSGEEWLPAETTREVLVTPLVAFSETGEAFAGKRDGNDYYFTVNSEGNTYKMPLIWYKGYRAETEDGNSLTVMKNAEDGLVLVSGVISAKDDVSIHVWYEGTALQKVSYIISLLFVMGVGISLVWKWRKG